MDQSPGIVTDAERQPPRPILREGACAFCGEAGRLVVRQFHVGGVGTVFRAVCVNPIDCAKRCDSDNWESVSA